MTERNAAWFSSYFGWRKSTSDDADRRDAARARDGVAAAARTSGEPTPRLKRAWRAFLSREGSHPPVGGA